MASRRDFLKTSAGVGVGAAVGMGSPRSLAGAPAVLRSRITPVAIASGNGMEAVATAFQAVSAGGDTLDAAVKGVNIVERDPNDRSVGYGGRPNLDGVVQLDSSVMHGPSRGAGAVACLEGIKTPSRVAVDVMRYTDHVLLVGKGAQRFAVSMGHKVEDLLTDATRRQWIEWRARMSATDDYLTREEAGSGADPFEDGEDEGLGMLDSHDGVRPQGTINCNVINQDGDLSGVTTTSGLAWKIPGRVGDSPILGAGLYVDNEIGAAGSTGRGEANLFNLASFLIVERMREGAHPRDAGMEALRRVQANTVESRLLNARGLPAFGLTFYVLDRQGRYAGVSMYASETSRYAVCTENGAALLPLEPLLDGSARD